MHRRRRTYHTYLLRCWAEEGDYTPNRAWRFVLEDPHSGERIGFATLQEFVAFITSVSPADNWILPANVNKS